jgi:DNA-binding Lrp family transcriptional regulator
MVTAILLMQVERTKVNDVATALAELDAVSEAYSVGGRYDVIAIVRTPTNEGLADLVTHRMNAIEGIRDTETLLAFRAYSRHDLESMFTIGLEEG